MSITRGFVFPKTDAEHDAFHKRIVQCLDESVIGILRGLTPSADKYIYFTSATAATLGTITTFGRSLVDDATDTAARSTLGLGTMAVQNANAVAITGGLISGCDITVGAAKTIDVSAGTLTLADNQISGDKVEGGTINAISITTLTSTTAYATTFDTNVAAAGVTLSGVTLAADGTDADISITITPKGTGVISASSDISLASGKVLKVNSVQVVGAQGAVVADAAAASGTATNGGWGCVSEAEFNALVASINAIKDQLNTALARLRAHGLLAT